MEIGLICFLLQMIYGFFLICVGSTLIYLIHKGSKVIFTYLLTSFTIAYGFDFLVRGIFRTFISQDRFFWYYLVYDVFWYIYFMLSVQGWVFGIKYLEASILAG